MSCSKLRIAILKSLPALSGYNSSRPKPTSDVFVTADRGEPLLARWRFGENHTTAAAAKRHSHPRILNTRIRRGANPVRYVIVIQTA